MWLVVVWQRRPAHRPRAEGRKEGDFGVGAGPASSRPIIIGVDRHHGLLFDDEEVHLVRACCVWNLVPWYGNTTKLTLVVVESRHKRRP